MSFDGFPRSAFEWFAGLERDNSRDYFVATRDVYENDVRRPLEEMLDALVDEFGTGVKLFRQNRDVRFSRDKSPYKTTTYGIVAPRPDSEAGFYAQLSARGLYAATGYHEMAGDQLRAYRDAVADDSAGATLEAVVAGAESRGLELLGESLKTAPRGMPRDHPRGRLLRHKSLYGGRAMAPGRGGAISRKAALEHVTSVWRDLAPLNAWLDEHVGRSAIPPRERYGRGRRLAALSAGPSG